MEIHSVDAAARSRVWNVVALFAIAIAVAIAGVPVHASSIRPVTTDAPVGATALLKTGSGDSWTGIDRPSLRALEARKSGL